MNRAYSILTIKTVNEDDRVIEGIASTPTPDRMGDIVEPMGAQFKLPMPLLWQHDSRAPVGEVMFAKPTKDGIPFRAEIKKTDEPGRVKDRLDEAWQSIKLKLVRAVSIGFSINAYEILKSGGWRINEWEWLELSLVTIPANADATITSIRSIDAELLAATGHKQDGGERTVKAGASATRSTKVVKAQEARPMTKKTIAEQIAGFEATRAAKEARMTEIQSKASDEGRTKDAAEKEEFNTLKDDIAAIDAELVDLREMEKINVARAVEVKGATAEDASRSRGEVTRVQVMPKKLPPGLMFARYVGCLAANRFSRNDAADFAKQKWPDHPELELVIRTTAAGSTTDSTWASPLVQLENMASEFIEFLRPQTIIGRLPGLRRVPFNIKVPRQTAAASLGWVGEGSPKPVSALAFDSVELRFAKAAGIVALNDELIKFSQPSADMLVRDDLAKGLAQFIDHDFVDPTKAAEANVSPASVTYGVSPITATGATADAFRTDFGSMLSLFLESNLSVDGLVILMKSTRAAKLGLMRNDLGVKEFPDINAKGGVLEGFPVLTSENIPATGGSPTDGDLIIGIAAPEVLLADDGGINVDSSREASLQMESSPDSPQTASTVYVSLWQKNMTAIRVERFINWEKRRDEAVQFIQNAKYA